MSDNKLVRFLLMLMVLLLQAMIFFVLVLGVSVVKADVMVNPTVVFSVPERDVGILQGIISRSERYVSSETKLGGVVKITSTKVSSSKGLKDVTVEFDKMGYLELLQEQKSGVMRNLLGEIEESNLSSISKTKFYNFVSKQDETVSSLVRELSGDVRADYVGAYQWFRPFAGPVSTLLGLACIVLMLLITVTITLDLAYLGIPMLNSYLTDVGENKKNYVSQEALRAYRESAESNGTWKNSFGIYFMMKSKQLAVVGICLLYLMSGQIYDLIATFMDHFQGVVEVLNMK